MTDNTATHNEGLWLPEEAWATIASFLDNNDLARFRQLCTATQFVGSHVFILQPLYNRLYAIDNTLPPILPPEGTLTAFKQAFEKIQARQQFEISYLTEHHSAIMAKPEYLQVFQESATVSLQSLEAINVALDKINSEIITARIDITSSSLSLNNAYITRLPVTLFQEPAYAHFWKNLIHLYCFYNQLTTLDVQGLSKLQGLNCSTNQLTTMDVQGLAALQSLDCSANQLTTMDVQGLAALQHLLCHNNQLTELNVQGLAGLQKLWCNNNQLAKLDVQGLAALQHLLCHNNQLTKLDVQGLAALKGLGCQNNQLTSLNVQGLAALQGLDCGANQLTTMDVQGLAALQHLLCRNNQLTELNVQGLTALQGLDCSTNQLTTMDVQGLAALQGLDCHNNQLAKLNVQGLVALQWLACGNNNQLTSLNAQGLTALKGLVCNNNQLTKLDVQGLAALQALFCDNNPLKALILTGVPANVKNKYAELERSLLFNQLSQTESVEARQVIIRRLDSDYTYDNCLKYCPVYATTLFEVDSANSALSQASAFLPSFETANTSPEKADLKRKRDEDEMRTEEPSEESGNQPDAKKRKRK